MPFSRGTIIHHLTEGSCSIPTHQVLKAASPLLPHKSEQRKTPEDQGIAMEEVVGETGFEPATSGSQNQRSTKLSYSPSLVRAGNCVRTGRLTSRNDIRFAPLATAPEIVPFPISRSTRQTTDSLPSSRQSHRPQKDRFPPPHPEFLWACDRRSLAGSPDSF